LLYGHLHIDLEVKKGVILCSMCSLCGNNVEYFSHLYFNCFIVIMGMVEGSFLRFAVFFFGFGCSIYEVSL